jgi:hypothetical protein
VPTQLEKTAAFLKKISASATDVLKDPQALYPGSMAPGEGVTPVPGTQLRAGEGVRSLPPVKPDQRQLSLLDAAESRKPKPPGMLDRAGKLVEDHQFAAGAAAGATALLAGVLTYNMLKKKQGKVTQMPGQRKVANMPDPDEPTSEERNAARQAEAAKNAPKPPGRLARGATAVKNFAKSKGGIATGLGLLTAGAGAGGYALGGDEGSPLDASGGKTWAGKTLGVSTGSDIGDAAAGAGIAGLGALGVYKLYKMLRGN